MARMGRPPSENPRVEQYRVRLTEEELRKLDYIVEVTGMTKAAVLRLGIDKVYTSVKRKQK